jgi:hypothetical protein
MDKLCKNCKHWNWEEQSVPFGNCLLFERETFEKSNVRREDMAYIDAGTQEGGADYESLCTNLNFGCVLFEAKV